MKILSMAGRMVIILALISIFGLAANCSAVPDYSKAKGDFKIFDIGDSKAEVLQKLSYLAGKGEISEVTGVERFLSETLDQKIACSFRYHKGWFGKERVSQIVIDFYEHHSAPAQYDPDVKEFARYLQSLMEKTYGPAHYIRPYLFLSELKKNQEKNIAVWAFSLKIIGVAITRTDQEVYPQIIISNSTLSNRLERQDKILDFN